MTLENLNEETESREGFVESGKLVDDILANSQFDKSFILDYPFTYFVDEIRLSHSTLQTLESCPRKFEFSKLFQNPKHEDSLATGFGTALHRGFQDWLINHDYNHAVYQMMLAYPWELGESPMKDRSAEGALALLDEMIKQFPEERYELAYIEDADGNKLPCVEVPFKLIFDEMPSLSMTSRTVEGSACKFIPLFYVGYMDLVLYDKVENKFIVIDIKTTSDRLEDLSPKYKFSDQTVPYGLVLNKLMGLLLDELEVGYYTARPSLMDPKVELYRFYKSGDDLADWAKGMASSLNNLAYWFKNCYFPRTRNGCSFFGRTCPYYNYCQDRNIKRTQIQLAYDGEMSPALPFETWCEVHISLKEIINGRDS